jgi:uncharacterized membrane protein
VSVAVVRRSVPLSHHRSKNNSAVLFVSAVITVLTVGLCLMLAAFHPAGQIGSSRVLAGRAGGGIYDAPEGYR